VVIPRRVDQCQDVSCPPDPAATFVTLGEEFDVGHLESRGLRQGVDRGRSALQRKPAGQVECGAHGCRHGHAADDGQLVVIDGVGPGANARRRVPVRMEQLGRYPRIEPLGPV
jgi:hypothetical protein